MNAANRQEFVLVEPGNYTLELILRGAGQLAALTAMEYVQRTKCARREGYVQQGGKQVETTA